MDWAVFNKVVGEIGYILIALIFLLVGINAYRTIEGNKKYTTLAFWVVLAFAFACGPYLPPVVTGICVCILAVLTGMKGVTHGKVKEPSREEARKHADKLGYKVFIPVVVLAIAAVLIATVFNKKMSGAVVLGLSGMIGLIVALLVTKAKPQVAVGEGVRLMDNVGTTGILPQLLSALGAVFTAAGVGEVISKGVTTIIPKENLFIAAAVYCIGMALFTMIMGNGFAAFSVITVGIGIPFLIEKGANPAILGALGLTAGYCGTLMTPMAANFNIMPAALLETQDQYAIIKRQIPFALVMLVIHILLLYFLAF